VREAHPAAFYLSSWPCPPAFSLLTTVSRLLPFDFLREEASSAPRRGSSRRRRTLQRPLFPRIEIRSPGALLSTLTLDRLKLLDGAHASRNALVARALREAGYMRELGEGMKRIFQLMEESDLQRPDLHTDSTSFAVTLYHRSVFNAQQLAWLSMFEWARLSKLQQRIVIAGMHDRALAPQDIYRAMNTDDRDTYDREVTQLRKADILVEIRTNPQATQLSRKTGKPKAQIPRFKVVNPQQTQVSLSVATQAIAKIVVFGLPVDATEEELRAVFTSHGRIMKIELPMARPEHMTRFAFIAFENPVDALGLISGDRVATLRGTQLRVERYDLSRSRTGQSYSGIQRTRWKDARR